MSTDDYFCNIFNMMSDDKRHYALYLSELTKMFKQFKADYDNNELDLFVTDSIFELLESKDVPVHELETFVVKYEAEFKKYIHAKNGLLFQQPSIILVLYYFINARNFLRDNWPLNNEVLKSIYKVTGTSYEDY